MTESLPAQYMHDETERLIAQLNDVRLSESERAAIRTRLVACMREHPVATPLRLRIKAALARPFSHMVLPRYAHFALASMLLVCMIGSGTAYASMLSLPGDTLYSLKVDLIEPLSGVFVLSPQAKAEWSAQLANRRLVEAEDLAAQGKLTPDTSTIVTTQLQSVTQAFDESVQTLQDDNDTAAALDAQTTMTAALQAHQQVLASVAPQSDQAALQPIIAVVENHVRTTNAARRHAQDHLPDAKPVAIAQQQAAEQAISSMQALAADAQQSLDDQASQTVLAKSETMQRQVDEGNQNLQQGRYIEAMSAFQSAIQSAKDTDVRVDAMRRFRWKAHMSAFVASSSPNTAASSTVPDTIDASSTDDTATTTDASSTSTPQQGASPDSLFEDNGGTD